MIKSGSYCSTIATEASLGELYILPSARPSHTSTALKAAWGILDFLLGILEFSNLKIYYLGILEFP
ncbi:hypothetical protein, partial [Campylobacter sp.]|uniref:hypothetical protein n=1 Tax=Campylobacter sp. TaxID=205 RepID=UPI002AA83634